MKKKILTFLCVLAIIFCSVFSSFKLQASTSHYNLTLQDNALIFTFPDYHGSYTKEFIGVNGETIVNRVDNTLLIDSEPIEPVSAYNYIWAWYFEYRIIGVDDYLVEMRVYNLLATEYMTSNFELIGQYEIPVTSTSVILSIDYDSTLETLVNFGFDGSNIKAYLENNGLQPEYSALGDMLDEFYTSGYNNGFNSGYNNGINEQISTQNWWSSLWNGVDAFLSVELLPNLTFGLLFAVPLVFGVLHLILFIWRSGD